MNKHDGSVPACDCDDKYKKIIDDLKKDHEEKQIEKRPTIKHMDFSDDNAIAMEQLREEVCGGRRRGLWKGCNTEVFIFHYMCFVVWA